MADTVSVNQKYFNQIASEYDQRFGKTLVELEEKIRESKDFIRMKQGGRVLDYACGTGLLSRALGDEASQCIGIDITENMVGAYNAKAMSEDLYPNSREAHLGNLILPSDPAPAAFSDRKFFDFDFAGVGAGFHHFEDPDLAAKRLAERLQPGGVFFIFDFMPHEVENLHSHGVAHHGFSEVQMKQMFEGAGVGGDFGFKDLGPIVFHNDRGEGENMTRRIFFARGTKM